MNTIGSTDGAEPGNGAAEASEASEDGGEIRAGVSATSFQVGTIETVDGDKVYLVVNAHESDEQPLAIPAGIAGELGQALKQAAKDILDEDDQKDEGSRG